MKKTFDNNLTFVVLAIFYLLTENGYAQSYIYERKANLPLRQVSKGLVIGDSLPDYIWNETLEVGNHPDGKTDFIRLRDYREKFIILDFWATSCKGCIESIDKLDELYPTYADQMVVLPVNILGIDQRAIAMAKDRRWGFPIVVGYGAKLLNELFYHEPGGWGQVWIKDGRLLAMPYNSSANTANFDRLLNGMQIDLKMVEGANSYFESKLINEHGEIESKSAHPYTTTLSGPYRDYRSQSAGDDFGVLYIRDSTVVLHKNETADRLIFLAHRHQLYSEVNDRSIPSSAQYPMVTRYRLKNELYARWFEGPQLTGISHNDHKYYQWLDSNWYCYHAGYSGKLSPAEVYRKMQQELNEFFGERFGVRAYIENEASMVWELTVTDTTALSTRGGKPIKKVDEVGISLQNQHVSVISEVLRELAPPNTRIVNKINLPHHIDLVIPECSNLDCAKNTLAKYGLIIREYTIDFPVLIVEQDGWDRQLGDREIERHSGTIVAHQVRPKEVEVLLVRDYTQLEYQ